MIKSANVSLRYNNTNKLSVLDVFLTAYRDSIVFYINYYWKRNKLYKLNPSKKSLKTGIYYPYNPRYNSILSERALKSAKTQALGMIKSSIQKHKQRLYVLGDLQRKGKQCIKLQQFISNVKLIKPSVHKHISAELCSLNIKIVNSNIKEYDLLFELSAMFNKDYKKTLGFNKIILVSKKHKHLNELSSKGNILSSFLVSRDKISIRYDIKEGDKVKNGLILGVDQGITNIYTAVDSSNKIQQSGACPHGHTLKSILDKLSRKQKGSKGFKKSQEHRTNYVNYSLKQLNLDNVKELRLEGLKDINRGQSVSRLLSSFPYPLIKTKLQNICLISGVHFVQQSNMYRSQRCSCCGFVLKRNRVGKTFICRNCGFATDSDVNAAINHVADLPPIYTLVSKEAKKTGFFWNPIFLECSLQSH